MVNQHNYIGHRSNLIKTATVLVLLILIYGLQYYSDAIKNKGPKERLTIMPARIIRALDLGLHSAAASLQWINAIQKFGSNVKQFPSMIENINQLDPKFSYPYAFGTLVLPPFGLKEKAVEIGQKGLKQAEPDWRIPFYLATTYHIFFGDRINAALNFNLAASMPNSPDNIRIVAAKYGTSTDHRSQTKNIWQSIYQNSKDEFVKEAAIKYILQIETMELLEKAAQIYKQKFGYYPSSVDDLTAKNIIKSSPDNPLSVEFGFDKAGQVIVK